MRKRNIILLAVALVILLPLAAILIFVASFNPNRYKPQIIAAVETATHRQVSITGPLHLAASLTPVISASGITLANPPGYPDADMLTLSRIEAQVALLPLLGHRIDLVHLTLDQPVITLERNAQGLGNWVFQQPAPTTQAGPPEASGHHATIALQSVSIRNGTLIIKQAQATRTLTIARLTARAQTLDAPLDVRLSAAYNGQPFDVTGTTGPISWFSTVAPGGTTAAWPVDATVSAAGATAHVKGSIAHPRSLGGYDLMVNGTAPDLAALDPYAGGYALPPLKSVAFAGRIAGSGEAVPAITDAQASAGAADLGAIRPGLQLASLHATMASLDAPLHVDAAGSLSGKALALSGTAGPLSALLPQPVPASPQPGSTMGQPAPQPGFALNMTGSAGNAHMSISGTIAAPLRLAGAALKLTAQIPDLSHLSPLAGTPLPALTHLGATASFIDPGGLGLRRAIGFQSLAVSSDQAQFGGAGSLSLGAVPDLQAIIKAPRIDLSAVLAAMPQPASPAQPGQPAASPAPAQSVPVQSAPNQLIPNIILPFGILRQAAGNVELSVGQLLYRGIQYDAVQAHGLLQNAVLTVRPFSVQLPGGGITGTVSVNAAANPPQLSFAGQAPAFGVAPLLASLNLPHRAAGTVQAYANLAGQGDTPHEIAATLNGTLGISMVNGVVDGAVIDHFFGTALRAENLPESAIGAQGPALIRCFAARVDSRNGTGVLRALTLESSRLYLTGTGTMNFGPETLNLVLQPQMQLGNGAVPLPVRVGGSFAQPSPGIAPPGDYGATASALGQHFAANRGFLGTLARRLGIAGPAPSPQSCTGALALARLGHPGAAPAPAPAAMPGGGGVPQGANQPPASGPQNLLQNLFR
jgi:AsmA protein